MKCEGEIEHRVDPLVVGKPDYFSGIAGFLFAGIVNALSYCLMLFGGGRHSFVCASCGQRFRKKPQKRQRAVPAD